MLGWDQLGGMEEKQEWNHFSEVDNYYVSSVTLKISLRVQGDGESKGQSSKS